MIPIRRKKVHTPKFKIGVFTTLKNTRGALSTSGIAQYCSRLVGAIGKRKNLGMELTVINQFSFAYIRYIFKNLFCLATKRRPLFDLIHYTEPAQAALSFLMPGCKTAVSIHDLYSAYTNPVEWLIGYSSPSGTFARIDERIMRGFIEFGWRIIVPFALRYSDHIIAVSELTKTKIISKTGIDGSKIDVVYPIIDASFKPLKRRRSSKVIIGHISSYHRHKNVGVLVRAFQAASNPWLELHLYGGNLTRFRTPYKRIKYFGKVPQKRMNAVFNSFDVFVFPSIIEGFGMPVMEAKRCKVPVITYAGAELPRIVKQNTLQFKDEGDLTRILDSSAWEKVNIKEAYLDAKRCDEERILAQLIKIYKEILNDDKERTRR